MTYEEYLVELDRINYEAYKLSEWEYDNAVRVLQDRYCYGDDAWIYTKVDWV